MLGRAAINVARGTRITRSSGPQPLPASMFGMAASVMSDPMMAKSPLSISRTAGQLWPLWQSSGSFPMESSLRVNMAGHRYYSNVPCQSDSSYPRMMSKSSSREAICSGVAKLLKDLRQEQGLSMTRLAEQAGLSRAMISFVESGFRNPTLDTLLRICAVLDVELADVLTRASREPSKARKS